MARASESSTTRRLKRRWRSVRHRYAFHALALGLAVLAGLALARMG